MIRYAAVIVPGGRSAAERAIEDCVRQNGGALVGNPTVQHAGMALEGDPVTIIIFEEGSDPNGWWREYARVHGWKRQKGVT